MSDLLTIERRPWLGLEDDDAPRVRIGAPPLIVATGAPGARAEVLAYANRVNAAIEDFDAQDVLPRMPKKPDTGGLWGDVVEGWKQELDPNDKDAVHAWIWTTYGPWRNDWEKFFTQIQSFDVAGPSPSEAWQRVQMFEADLRTRREELAKLTGGKLKSNAPAPVLESPGGLDPTPTLNAIPWTGILAVGGLLGLGFVLSSTARLVRG